MKKKSLLFVFTILSAFGVLYAQTDLQRQEIKANYDLEKLSILESEMTDNQKYLANQITDLRNKESKLQFDMDQIKAALTLFQNTFIQSTQDEAKEVLKENKGDK